MSFEDAFVPRLRTDLLLQEVGPETVVWSPIRGEPASLDPVATVMLKVVDGSATVADLVEDVEAVVAVPDEVARAQVLRTLIQMDQAGLLETSQPAPPARETSIFVSPVSSCMETSSCTGRVTPVGLEIAGQPIRVACATRKVARKLRAAVDVPSAPDDAPLGFLVRAARRGVDGYELVDRGGLSLGSARRTDEVVAMVSSHLAGLLPAAPGRVRIRVRALVRGDQAVLCTFPLLLAPPPDVQSLASLGYRLLDRLVVDLDVVSGCLIADPAPWQKGAAPAQAPGHIGGLTHPVQVNGVVLASPGDTAAPASPAQVIAALAAEAVQGERGDILSAATLLGQRCALEQAAVTGAKVLEAALRRLEARSA